MTDGIRQSGKRAENHADMAKFPALALIIGGPGR